MTRATPSDARRRQAVGPRLREGLVGIALVTAVTAGIALVGWLLSVAIAWVY